ncbi:MAG: hypothetical protein ACR2QC_03625 [Gammaproteobacteria bacterium]
MQFTICAFGAEIPAFAGMGMRFRLSPEWRILIKGLKVPPFRRKRESPPFFARKK